MLKNTLNLITSSILLFTGCVEEKKPNVILFVVDDLGWTDLGCYGSDLHQTPNLDKLSDQGLRFTNAYSACTVCSPTRASIMTGKYPARMNTTDWFSGHKKPFAKMKIPEWTDYMALEEFTLAEALQAEDYQTIHLGKWHLGYDEKYWPENQGFEINIGGWEAGQPRIVENTSNGYFSPYGNPRLKDGPEGEYLTERIAEEATSFLKKRNRDKRPFFMNLSFYNVHTPLQAKQKKIEKYKKLVKEGANHTNPVYAAMVEHVDDAIGKVLNVLDELELTKNTIVIFTSDNGGLCGNYENMRQKVTSNFPLRSGKGDMFEGGIRVPFIVKWPAKVPEGQIDNTPIISTDIYPTILGLLGIWDESQNKLIDGNDLSELLIYKKPLSRESIFWHYPHYHLEGAKPYSAIRKGNWKLIEVFEYDEVMLFDLDNDIEEKNNLNMEYPQKKEELLDDLNKWREDVKAQLPIENPKYHNQFQNEWKSGKNLDKTDEEFLKLLINNY